jgi:hypothetical protein
VASNQWGQIQEYLRLDGNHFVDDDGDGHAATEFEVRLLVGGELGEKVWTLSTSDPATLRSARLADGEFVIGGQLLAWKRYAARVRYQDDACQPEWSEWSAPVSFRIDDGTSAYWFDQFQVRDIHVDLSPESIASINAEAIPNGCTRHQRSYYAGTVTIDGQVYDGAGVRVKGGCGSARRLDAKAGLKINLSWDDPAVEGCPEERRYQGLERLTLNSMVQDPSYTHEQMAYRFLHAMDAPAPRVAYSRILLNGESKGVHLHVETIDRRFLSRWFGSNQGALFEGIYWCELLPENLPPNVTPEASCFEPKFEVDECDTPNPEADPVDHTLLTQLAADLAAIPDGQFSRPLGRVHLSDHEQLPPLP